MKVIDTKDLNTVIGAGQSGIAIRKLVRLTPKTPTNPLPLPKPGPVVG